MKPRAMPEIANPANLCHLPHPVWFIGSCLGRIAPETTGHDAGPAFPSDNKITIRHPDRKPIADRADSTCSTTDAVAQDGHPMVAVRALE